MVIRALATLLLLASPGWAQNFTTAAEVKPILVATKANWIAVREYEGQDLLYFTHIEAWRCGLSEVNYMVNQGTPQAWQMEPCYEDTAQPNAIKAEGRLPFIALPLGATAEVIVSLVFDDGSIETEKFERAAILMP